MTVKSHSVSQPEVLVTTLLVTSWKFYTSYRKLISLITKVYRTVYDINVVNQS